MRKNTKSNGLRTNMTGQTLRTNCENIRRDFLGLAVTMNYSMAFSPIYSTCQCFDLSSFNCVSLLRNRRQSSQSCGVAIFQENWFEQRVFGVVSSPHHPPSFCLDILRVSSTFSTPVCNFVPQNEAERFSFEMKTWQICSIGWKISVWWDFTLR